MSDERYGIRNVLLLAACLTLACDHVDRICRINDGWPCTCDVLGEKCLDGTTCVNLAASFPESAPSAASGTTGYCAPSCQNPSTDICPGTPWGMNTLCWTKTYTDDIHLCILYCEKDGDCPPGQECTEGSYCHPHAD